MLVGVADLSVVKVALSAAKVCFACGYWVALVAKVRVVKVHPQKERSRAAQQRRQLLLRQVRELSCRAAAGGRRVPAHRVQRLQVRIVVGKPARQPPGRLEVVIGQKRQRLVAALLQKLRQQAIFRQHLGRPVRGWRAPSNRRRILPRQDRWHRVPSRRRMRPGTLKQHRPRILQQPTQLRRRAARVAIHAHVIRAQRIHRNQQHIGSLRAQW